MNLKALAFCLALGPVPALAQDLDLVDVTLVDGTGAAPRQGISVSVRGGRIAAISDRAPAATAGVRRINLAGRYLLPGLIDAHVHIESPAAALRALRSGVTTARVLNDNNLQASGTRDLIRLGHVRGPELLVSPGHIRPKPGMAFFEVYPQFGDAIRDELFQIRGVQPGTPARGRTESASISYTDTALWGGNLVIELAWRAPDKVRGVCAVDGGTIELGTHYPKWEDCAERLRPPALVGMRTSRMEGFIRQAHDDQTAKHRARARMTAASLIDYDALTQEALRGVVRNILGQVVAKGGLPGEHHFYISFSTQAPNVVLSRRLKEEYPDEMMIVLQHRF